MFDIMEQSANFCELKSTDSFPCEKCWHRAIVRVRSLYHILKIVDLDIL